MIRNPLALFAQRVWAVINSALFIAVMASAVLAALTNWYALRQSSDSDRQLRRAELVKLLVELDLRIARLKIAADQTTINVAPAAEVLKTVGNRSIAIVDGDLLTVTSNPAFRNEHLVSLLSRAEFDAGVALTDKNYLITFTDLNKCAAARQVKYVYGRLKPLVFFLESRLADGSIPQTLGSRDNLYQSEVYSEVSAQVKAAEEKYDALPEHPTYFPFQVAC